MKEEDIFEFNQYPDFIGMAMPFSDDLFDTEKEVHLEDGIIERPFFPLRDLVLFPQMVMPLFVGRERSLAAIQAALASGESLVVSAQEDGEIADPTEGDIYRLGTEVAIGRTLRMPDSTTSVLAQGRRRVEILEFVQWDPYIRVRVRPIPEPDQWQHTKE